MDADEQLPILDVDELVVVVGTAEEAEESLGEWKLAGLCGTPGCYKPDFHDGVCTPDEVSGSRRRKISSGFSGGCGPGRAAGAVTGAITESPVAATALSGISRASTYLSVRERAIMLTTHMRRAALASAG